MKYRLGTRASKLALAQTRNVADQLHDANSDAEFEIVKITTKGDIDSRPFFAIDQKGIFEKEIDAAVSEGRVDFAVHSMKDVPSELDLDLFIASVPKRKDVNDVLLSLDGAKLENLKSGSVIGTSSLRRAVQISRKRSDLVVKPIRGNIETRIDKIGNGFDAIILAQAGISRLNIKTKYVTLSLSDFLPSPGQGALAIIARASDADTITMLKSIDDTDAHAESLAERALSKSIESGCRFPVGAIAGVDSGVLSINAVAFSMDGKESVYAEQNGPVSESEKIGYMAGKELIDGGADKFASDWRVHLAEWNKDG
ncbi:MAG: hydroxymethylbilane synthase [Cenarchaeum symbiont of Oopsacas minuta]|nr:hydroxymethylbilane synthase [Cenarchaeum symbiont of Oopsacas minuta]